MDGRGRLAQSLTWIARLRARPPTVGARAFVFENLMRASRPLARRMLFRARGWFLVLLRVHVPRGVGMAAAALMILSSIVYGTVEGGHVPTIVSAFKEARDQAANAAGFRIISMALSGNVRVSREEVLAIAGVTGTTSLLFLDVVAVRERLRTNPWIADAAVLKLYTGEAYKAVSDLGLQILGGYGYCMEYPMQRFFRDSRLAVIGAGTSEIQRNIIARGLGL